MPAAQAEQLLAAPYPEEKRPTEQLEHPAARVPEYLPGEQELQAEAVVEYLPAAQLEQELPPPPEEVPAEHE